MCELGGLAVEGHATGVEYERRGDLGVGRACELARRSLDHAP